MTKEEFIKYYAGTEDNIPLILEHYVPLPCYCGIPECHGWAMIVNHPVCIRNHEELYGLQDKNMM